MLSMSAYPTVTSPPRKGVTIIWSSKSDTLNLRMIIQKTNITARNATKKLWMTTGFAEKTPMEQSHPKTSPMRPMKSMANTIACENADERTKVSWWEW